MTLSTTITRAEHDANGATKEFSFGGKIISDADLIVELVDADDNAAEQELGVDYTVSGVGDAGGCTVVFEDAPGPGTLVIRRLLELEQQEDIRNSPRFYPERHEAVFDRHVMIDQQQQEEIERSLRVPVHGDHYDADSKRIENLAAPISSSDAARLADVQSAGGSGVGAANLVTVDDAAGHFDGDNVEEVLAELGTRPRYARTTAEIAAEVTPTDTSYRYSPERYGAAGDGVTDDTEALQAWASVSDPRELLDRTYKCNDRLTGAKHAKWRGAGMGKSKISFAGATGTFTGNRCVDFSQGSFVDLPALSGDVAEGDTQLPFASAHNRSVGDIIFLHDATAGSWSGHLDTYTKGEACIVAEVVSDTVVGLMAPLYDSYTSSSTDVYHLDYGTVDLDGFSIEGVSTDSAVMDLFISHAAHVRIRNVKATVSGLTATTIRYCMDVEASGFVSHQYHEGTESGVGQYGVSIIHCQDVRLNGHFQGQRHAVTTGSTSGDGGIVNRGIIVHGHLQSLIDSAADFHGNTEYSAYDGCVIRGGVALGGNKNAARNLTLLPNTLDDGKLISWREMKGFDFDVESVRGRTLGNPLSVGGQGVIDMGGNDSSTLNANTTLGGVLSFTNVKIDAPNAEAGVVMFNRGCTQDLDIRVNGLYMGISAAANTSFGFFRLDNLSGGNFRSISLYDADATPGVTRAPSSNFDVDDIVWEHQKGTFTPEITFGGAFVDGAYSMQYGIYELVGNVVHWEAQIVLSAKGSSTGSAVIKGLPFPVLASANAATPAIVQGSGMTFADTLIGIHTQGNSSVALQEVTNAGGLSGITDADFTDTTRLRLSGSYRRAA